MVYVFCFFVVEVFGQKYDIWYLSPSSSIFLKFFKWNSDIHSVSWYSLNVSGYHSQGNITQILYCFFPQIEYLPKNNLQLLPHCGKLQSWNIWMSWKYLLTCPLALTSALKHSNATADSVKKQMPSLNLRMPHARPSFCRDVMYFIH